MTEINIKKYKRKIYVLEAIQYTDANIEEIMRCFLEFEIELRKLGNILHGYGYAVLPKQWITIDRNGTLSIYPSPFFEHEFDEYDIDSIKIGDKNDTD